MLKRLLVTMSLGFVLLANTALGALPNPNPGTFADDTGDQLFAHGTGLFAFGLTAPTVAPSFAGPFVFGFFFDDRPLIPSNFISLVSGGTGVVNGSAVVNFSAGTVVNANGTSTFTPDPSPIGFVFSFVFAGQTTVSLLSTLNTLNPGGLDLVGTFPLLSNPQFFLIEGRLPVPLTSVDTFDVGITVVGPLAPVPEPSTTALLSIGLAALLLFGFFRRKMGVAS